MHTPQATRQIACAERNGQGSPIQIAQCPMPQRLFVATTPPAILALPRRERDLWSSPPTEFFAYLPRTVRVCCEKGLNVL